MEGMPEPTAPLDTAQFVLSMHYLQGGHWWDIDVDKLFNDNTYPKSTSGERKDDKDTNTSKEDRNDRDENGNGHNYKTTSDATIDDNIKDNNNNKYNKPKKNKKSKKKCKRGHGKHHKTNENHRQQAASASTQTRPEDPETNNPTSKTHSPGHVTNIERNERFKMLGLDGYLFWPQFSSTGPADVAKLEDKIQTCAKCGIRSQNLMTCTRCRLAHYCSKSCEMKDTRRHKQTCCKFFFNLSF
ncbi:hypothetical protein ElyMa_000281200 [Elysia marginata]|uniref:MYND-type domain-containing protein n=1 Tax=Elysia marginata TaxID=1093978 RepID=A0AAV4F872_9GAST|nr:hypothetical protein ElyMa_000281200 [Elysia marginata]